jgi:hypothetical protein
MMSKRFKKGTSLIIKKKDLVSVIRMLQTDIKDKLVAARTTPKDKPWLDSAAWVAAEKFLTNIGAK